MSSGPIVRVRGLRVAHRGASECLRDVDLELSPGRVVAVVGESGAGKSTLGLALLGLVDPAASVQGTVEIDGRILAHGDESAWRSVRGRVVGLVSQDPLAALDPLMTILDSVAEGPRFGDRLDALAALARARAALERAGLGPAGAEGAEALVRRFPHELSGGQRQRALLACALAREPRVLVADEPTSALDATLALHVVRSLRDLARRDGLAVLWITHDLPAALAFADEALVLRAGEVVERGDAASLRHSRHPYTRALAQAGGLA